MCTSIRFGKFEIPEENILAHGLKFFGDEVRVNFRDANAFLPVVSNGNNLLIEWGSKDQNSHLPRTGFCKNESLTAGKWQWLNPCPVTILAGFGLINGVWFQVRQGIRGVNLKDEKGNFHVYILTMPSTHYFKTMTGSLRMPVLIDQIL